MKSKRIPFTSAAMVSLGCQKNTVDAEIILGYLRDAGLRITADPSDAEIIIVNTCGFLKSAREEAIETLQEMTSYRRLGRLKRLVVTGCMADADRETLLAAIPEIDLILSPFSLGDSLNSIIDTNVLETERVFPPEFHSGQFVSRLFVTPKSYGLLKISDGCDNRCSYCRIPFLRGRYRSKPLELIIQEAKQILQTGRRELIIISQDNTRYGRDLGDGTTLGKLLDSLSDMAGLLWIRLMYMYPDRITPDIIERLKSSDVICRYLDIPLQHVDGKILKKMNRPGNFSQICRMVESIRDQIPDIALRTTLMTGFPGEDDASFRILRDFVERGYMNHIGVFAFSPEPGTAAAEWPRDVSNEIAEERRGELMAIQQEISYRYNREKIHTVEPVIVDGGTDDDAFVSIGRVESQAPEVDGVVYINGGIPAGTILPVKITAAEPYDLWADPIAWTEVGA